MISASADASTAVRSVALTPYSTITPATALIGPNCLDLTVASEPNHAPLVITPYADAAAIQQAATYCWATSLALCHRLAPQLSALVNETHPSSYWEALLLVWANGWIENLYDRYLRLCWIRDYYPDAAIELPTLNGIAEYRSSVDVGRQAHTHPINIRFYGELLDRMGLGERVRNVGMVAVAPAASSGAGPRSLVRLRRTLHRLLRPSPYARAGLGWFEASNLTVRDFGFAAEHVDRHRLAIEPLAGEFGSLVSAMAPQAVPASLVEEYRSRRRYTLTMIASRRIRSMFVPHTIYSNDGIKYLAAELRERSSPVVTRQHGHGYGTLDTFSNEWVERRLSDRFVTWGWTDDHGDTVPLPEPSLEPPRPPERRSGPDILYVMNEGPAYLYRYVHAIVPDRLRATYFPWQEKFFRALAPVTRARIVIRPYGFEYGWGQGQRLSRVATGVRIDASGSCRDRLLGSRLLVIDYPGTTMLEALAWNVPMVAFWAPGDIPVRPSARTRYDALRSAGILHDSPEAAARQLADVGDDPMMWWRRPEVQSARLGFCGEFARGADDWPDQWRTALGPLVGYR